MYEPEGPAKPRTHLLIDDLAEKRQKIEGLLREVNERSRLKNVFDEQWAHVELYRWQHGELPGESGREHPFSIPEGLRAMAGAIKAGDKANFPSPFNVMIVLEYCARLIEEHEIKTTRKPGRNGPCPCGSGRKFKRCCGATIP